MCDVQPATRCFRCLTAQQFLEETASGWIEHDVEEVFEDREKRTDEQFKSTVGRRSKSGAASAPAAGSKLATGDADASGVRPRRPSEKDRHSRQRRESDKKRDRPSRAPTEHVQEVDADVSPRVYPTNLHVNGRIPHLMVLKVDTGGVRFAFDSAWLEHEGFRASMPVQCVWCGKTDRSKLIGRPVIFADRSHTSVLSEDRIAMLHENRDLGDRTPHELMRLMGTIEEMPRPFNIALPYYLCTDHDHQTLDCRTRERPSGRITCEVLIPDRNSGLEWLGRINGVCGQEYRLLSYDVSMLHGEAWQHLSETCRQRIVVWCKLDPNESFRAYFTDADFGRRDEGLGGLVITDQRLIFCKYHHRGQVRLDDDEVSILVKREDGFANLTLLTGHDRSRMVKMHRYDFEPLSRYLSEADGVRVQFI